MTGLIQRIVFQALHAAIIITDITARSLVAETVGTRREVSN
jgi:hypothetical protein